MADQSLNTTHIYLLNVDNLAILQILLRFS